MSKKAENKSTIVLAVFQIITLSGGRLVYPVVLKIGKKFCIYYYLAT